MASLAATRALPTDSSRMAYNAPTVASPSKATRSRGTVRRRATAAMASTVPHTAPAAAPAGRRAKPPAATAAASATGVGAATARADGSSVNEQLVPVQLVGRLIGRGGQGIRELREMSRATIKINTDCEPGTEQRKVTVTGTPDQLQFALSLIQQRLAQGP